MTCKWMVVAAALLAGCAGTPESKPGPNPTDAQMAFARLKLLVGHWNAQPTGETAPTPETPEPPAAKPTESEPPKAEPPKEEPPKAEPAKAEPAPGGEKSTEPAKPEPESGAAGAAPAAEPKATTIPVEYAVTAGGHALQEKLFAGTKEEMVTLYYLEGEGLALVKERSIGMRPHLRLDVQNSTRDDLHFEWDGSATDVDPKKDPHFHKGRIHFVDADTIECEWSFWADGKDSHTTEFTLSRAAGSFTPPPK